MTDLLILAAASCLMISDPDQRAYCRALESGRMTDCTAIANIDLRLRCRVELGDNVANCASIGNQNERAICYAKEQRRIRPQ